VRNDREPETVLLQLLASVDGHNTDADRVFVADVLHVATHFRVADGYLAECPVRTPRNSTARGIVEMVVRQLARLRRGAHCLQVVGAEAFTGLQFREVPPPPRREPTFAEEVMAETDREIALEASGVDVPRAKRKRSRVAITKGKGDQVGRQGGLAKECRRSTRTILRWAKGASLRGILRLSRVPRGAPDAVQPKRGQRNFPYPKWSLLREPPSGLLSALRVLWGERLPGAKRAAPERVPTTSAPVAAPRVKATPPTGPPPQAWDAYDAADVAEHAARLAAIARARTKRS